MWSDVLVSGLGYTYGYMEQIFGLIVVVVLLVVAVAVKAIRKTIGLLMVILGAIACFTFIGAIVGIPLIIVGGLLLFI